MYESSRISRPAPGVIRISLGGMHLDLIETSQGLVRMGSMPDASKLTAHHGLEDDLVVVPEWKGSQAGDNYTGEEFYFWRAQIFGHPGRRYIGLPSNLNLLRQKLDAVFPYFFDEQRINPVRNSWLDQWFLPHPVLDAYRQEDLNIEFENGDIQIRDREELIYSQRELAPDKDPDQAVEQVLSNVARHPGPSDGFSLTIVGSGNGFSGKSASLLVRFQRLALWIDPCAFPAHSLAQVDVHWDDVTHILITHNHEDHMSGFSACLSRCTAQRKQLKLITGREIYRILRQQFLPLFPEMDQWVSFAELKPGTPLDLGGLNIQSRWNHHFLPYGTLGLKLSAGDRCCGISGDTKYSTQINQVLGRPELEAEWFGECDLILHEIDFYNADGVHSHWEEVAKIRDTVSGKLYGYHSTEMEDTPIPLVRQGQTFRL